MSSTARKTAVSKLRSCFGQGTRPKSTDVTCAKSPQKANRESTAWQNYRELMLLIESVNNTLVVAQQFKSLIWKEDKIIECDATREESTQDESPFIAGALANLSPGKVKSRCADGVMIPQAKFQARTVPIEKM